MYLGTAGSGTQIPMTHIPLGAVLIDFGSNDEPAD